MALFRATQLLMNRILSGRIPPSAFYAWPGSSDQALGGDVGTSGALAGVALRELMDPVNIAFDLPPALRGPAESFPSAGLSIPAVRLAVPLDHVGVAFGLNLRGGPLFMNRYFELDLPLGANYTTVLRPALVSAGAIAPAGGLTNVGVPAALNSRLAGLTVSQD